MAARACRACVTVAKVVAVRPTVVVVVEVVVVILLEVVVGKVVVVALEVVVGKVVVVAFVVVVGKVVVVLPLEVVLSITSATKLSSSPKYSLLPILILRAGSTKTSHSLCSLLNSLNRKTSIRAPVFSLLPINLAGNTLVLLSTKLSPSSK